MSSTTKKTFELQYKKQINILNEAVYQGQLLLRVKKHVLLVRKGTSIKVDELRFILTIITFINLKF